MQSHITRLTYDHKVNVMKDQVAIRIQYRTITDKFFSLSASSSFNQEVNKKAIAVCMALWYYDGANEVPTFVQRLRSASRKLIYAHCKVDVKKQDKNVPLYTKGMFVCYRDHKVSLRMLVTAIMKLNTAGVSTAVETIAELDKWFNETIKTVLLKE